jgi:hypothetical protein
VGRPSPLPDDGLALLTDGAPHRCTLRGQSCGVKGRLAATCIAVLGSIVVSVAATPAAARAAQPEPLLTHDEAMLVLRRFERANARNNGSLGVEGQGAIEAPPIQLIDDANFREVRNRGGKSIRNQGTVRRRQVFVPFQTQYPLEFLASEGVSDGSKQLLVFTRPTESDTWKVSTAAQLVVDPVPGLVKDGAGYTTRLDADHAAALKLAPEQLAPALADLWARTEEGGAQTSELFESGLLTTDAVNGFVGELAASGIDGEVSFGFEPAPFPVVSYAATGGRALTVFAVAVHETIQPTGGTGVLEQPRSRGVFGGLVVPGHYGTVRYDRLMLLAAVVPPGGTSARVRVIGQYTGVVGAETTPADDLGGGGVTA